MPAPSPRSGLFWFTMKIFPVSLIVVMYLVCPQSAPAELKILEGEHTVTYDIVNPRGVAFIPDYANESFVQKVLNHDEYSTRVQVTSLMSPMKTHVLFPIPVRMLPPAAASYLSPEPERQSDDPSLVSLARDITKDSQYAHEAANKILSWMADNLTFDASISVPTDALSALRYKKAYCVGYSNLAVALLRAAGIPARVAHGYLPPGYEWGFSKEYWGVKVNDGGYHAYLEIYYPDTGWAFSDAEHSQNFVDPFHILLRVDGMEMPGAYQGGYLDVDKATFYTIFKENDNTLMVDELPLPKTKRLGRRLDDRQHAALVTGRVSDKAGNAVMKGSVVLWSAGRGTPMPFSDGRYAIAIPAPGVYRIELKGPGYAKSAQEVRVETGQVYKANFSLQTGGAIRGKVVDADGRPYEEGDVFYQEGNTSYGVPLDRDGTYTLDGLAPGTYNVTVTVGDKKISRSLNAEAGKVTSADFVIK